MFESAGAMGGVTGHASHFDERRDRIGERSDGTNQIERFNVVGKFRPALEAMFARDDQLRIGKGERARREDSVRKACESGDGGA